MSTRTLALTLPAATVDELEARVAAGVALSVEDGIVEAVERTRDLGLTGWEPADEGGSEGLARSERDGVVSEHPMTLREFLGRFHAPKIDETTRETVRRRVLVEDRRSEEAMERARVLLALDPDSGPDLGRRVRHEADLALSAALRARWLACADAGATPPDPPGLFVDFAKRSIAAYLEAVIAALVAYRSLDIPDGPAPRPPTLFEAEEVWAAAPLMWVAKFETDRTGPRRPFVKRELVDAQARVELAAGMVRIYAHKHLEYR